MSSPLNILLEMGFPTNRAEKALAITGDGNAETAMEWLLAHTDDPDIDEPLSGKESNSGASQPTSGEETGCKRGKTEDDDAPCLAKSLKCDECGKLMKSEADVEFHAAKSGHQNFSESTEEVRALTEEEKKEQLQKLEDRIKQRRLEKEAREKREQIERERMRRKTGQEMTEAKKKLEEEEIKRIADLRRKEKHEEKLARQKILDQIERDKQARREKFGGAPVTTVSDASSSTTTVTTISAASSTSVTATKKEYDQTRIQLRLPDGVALTQVFGVKEELAAVRLYVQMNRTELEGNFSMMTNFPKRVFTADDMEKPLYELGLVPSAVIIITKGQIH